MTTFKDSSEAAMKLLRRMGFQDIKITGQEQHRGETWITYQAVPQRDWPVVILNRNGSVRVEPWTYRTQRK